MIRRILAIAAILSIALVSAGLCDDRVALVERYLHECHEIGMFNGAVLVAEGDSVILHEEYGMADMERGIPITSETRFKIGSLTKQFTTVMILQLIEEGLVAFDDPITKRPYRPPAPGLREMLGKIIDEEGIESATVAYHEAAAADTLFYRRSERQINALGYDLLGIGMIDEALEIFRLNTVDHPKSSNVWDSYAEALAASGDTAAAIQNYRKSLELNSRNQNARDMIQRLGGR